MVVAICDSSAYFMNKFIEETNKISEEIDVVCFNGYSSLISSENIASYDCFFIATEIKKQSGVDVALDIYLKNPHAEIVFITENSEKYCQNIFDHSDKFKPFALLCKPVSRLLLRHVYEMIENVIKQRRNKNLIIRLEDKNYISVNSSDIMYIQHNNRISYIYTVDGECYSSKYSIVWFNNNLPDCFMHCAKSCIVNAQHIKNINGVEIILTDESSIWCSRQYRKVFVECFEKFYGR